MADEAKLPGKLQVAFQQIISEKELILFLLELYKNKTQYSRDFSLDIINGSDDSLPLELKNGKKIILPLSLEMKDKKISLILNDVEKEPSPPWLFIIMIILIFAMFCLNGNY